METIASPTALLPESPAGYGPILDGLRALYLDDPRPWLVGFSGGKDSTMVASLIFEAVASIPAEQRTKPIAILCTDTRVEIPAILEMVEGTLTTMRRHAERAGLGIEVHLLRPPPEQSFWVNFGSISSGAATRRRTAPSAGVPSA